MVLAEKLWAFSAARFGEEAACHFLRWNRRGSGPGCWHAPQGMKSSQSLDRGCQRSITPAAAESQTRLLPISQAWPACRITYRSLPPHPGGGPSPQPTMCITQGRLQTLERACVGPNMLDGARAHIRTSALDGKQGHDCRHKWPAKQRFKVDSQPMSWNHIVEGCIITPILRHDEKLPK